MKKYKIKTNSGAKKRFRVTKNGKIKRGKAFRSHILTKMSTKRKKETSEKAATLIRLTLQQSRSCCLTNNFSGIRLILKEIK